MRLGKATAGLYALTFVTATVTMQAQASAQISCDDSRIVNYLPALPNGCQKERISASGNQRPSMTWAMASGRDSWRDQVITKYGERFANWNNAACARQECVPGAIAGFTRCTLTAFPCASKPELKGVLELSSEQVGELQRLLRRFGYRLKVDGKFGDATAAALERWQRRKGLKPDGLPTLANLELVRKG